MNYSRMAYILLLQHCYAHNPSIIAKLSKPNLQWMDERNHLILEHNASLQLDCLSMSGKRTEINSLMAVLDQTMTHLGRRELHNLLQNPMRDLALIQDHYTMIAEMLTVEHPLWLTLERALKELPDIERLQRKLAIRVITPKELAILYKAYGKILALLKVVQAAKAPVTQKYLLSAADLANFNLFLGQYGSILNFDILECCYMLTTETDAKLLEFSESPIRKGILPDVDTQYEQMVVSETYLQQIVDHLNTFIKTKSGKKIEFKTAKRKPGVKKQNPTNTILATTIAKTTTLAGSPVNPAICGVLKFIPHTAGEKLIISERITPLCENIDHTKNWLRQRLMGIFYEIIDQMNEKFTFYMGLANTLAKLDLIQSYAKTAYRYNYHCPSIVPGNGSFLEARELRHPIIERLIDGPYTPYDLCLGSQHDPGLPEPGASLTNRTQGICLYGTNCSGKTSLAKAIALAVIMAQMGSYTACRLRYRPYAQIITRLNGSDNIFKGQSTFAVEMEELRTILRHANENALVVADELCSSTESDSATALTISTILYLLKAKASFILATHMHHLVSLPQISSIASSSLRICHLTISFLENTRELIYDRLLKDGPGSSNYGIMVAESLNLPTDFIQKSYEILRYVEGQATTILDPVKSRYNAKVYVDRCVNCGKTRAEAEIHTHHIIEQKNADERGLVGNMHKNVKGNLTALCRECHQALHQANKEFEVKPVASGSMLVTT